MKIAITTSSFAQFSEEPLQILKDAGIDYVLNPYGRKLTESEAIDMLKECVGVAAGTEPLTERLIASLPDLKVISRCGSGMDNVDIDAANKGGVAVYNTPEGPTLAVAELVLGLAMNLLRRITQMDRELRIGVWKKRMGNTLTGKRIGIIGFGRIGQAVAKTFSSFDVEIAYNDPFVDSNNYPQKDIDNLFGWSDIISLHCSKPKEDGYLIGSKQLNLMKPGSWIINASRGGVLSESAVYDSLQTGHLAGAAIDVFEKEPYDGILQKCDNAVLTPHIGSYAMESRIKMEIDTINNLVDGLSKL